MDYTLLFLVVSLVLIFLSIANTLFFIKREKFFTKWQTIFVVGLNVISAVMFVFLFSYLYFYLENRIEKSDHLDDWINKSSTDDDCFQRIFEKRLSHLGKSKVVK